MSGSSFLDYTLRSSKQGSHCSKAFGIWPAASLIKQKVAARTLWAYEMTIFNGDDCNHISCLFQQAWYCVNWCLSQSWTHQLFLDVLVHISLSAWRVVCFATSTLPSKPAPLRNTDELRLLDLLSVCQLVLLTRPWSKKQEAQHTRSLPPDRISQKLLSTYKQSLRFEAHRCVKGAHCNSKHGSEAKPHNTRKPSSDGTVVHEVLLHDLLVGRHCHLLVRLLLLGFLRGGFLCSFSCFWILLYRSRRWCVLIWEGRGGACSNFRKWHPRDILPSSNLYSWLLCHASGSIETQT